MPGKFIKNDRKRALAENARFNSLADRRADGAGSAHLNPGRRSDNAAVSRIAALICGARSRCDSSESSIHRLVRPRWLFSLGLLFWLCPKPAAHAQQALLSALSLDSIVQAQSPTNPIVALPAGQPRIGPVGISLGAYSGVGLDDNINLTHTNSESDVIVGTGVNLGAAWQGTGKSILQFSSQLGYNFYLQHPGHDYLVISPGSALTWGLGLGDWEIILFDQFNYSRNVIADPSVSNTSDIPIVDNNIGARAQWKPKHWLVDLGYSYDNYFSTSSQYNYLNNASHELFARGAWRFSNHAQLGLETSVSFTRFSYSAQQDNTSYSVGPYLVWPLDPFVNISFHGGPTFYDFTQSPQSGPNQSSQSGLNSYYVNFDVTHQMTRFITEELSVNRSVSLGYSSGAQYTEQLNVGYFVSWYPKPWLNLHLGLNYQNGQQPFEIPLIPGLPYYTTTTENFSRYGFNPGVYYQVTKSIGASLSYTHWTRLSNIDANKYSDDSVGLQVQYTF